MWWWSVSSAILLKVIIALLSTDVWTKSNSYPFSFSIFPAHEASSLPIK